MALKYKMPVMVLTDGYLANGAEPWRLPDVEHCSDRREARYHRTSARAHSYRTRDPETPRARGPCPVPGLEHRIGGLEKQQDTGNVSYDPQNHEDMTRVRQAKVDAVRADIPDLEVYGDDGGLLVVSWGGTFGAVRTAVDQARLSGLKVGHAHLRWLNPMPANLEKLLWQYDDVLVPELNMGQLAGILRQRYLVNAVSPKVQGKPFKVSECLLNPACCVLTPPLTSMCGLHLSAIQQEPGPNRPWRAHVDRRGDRVHQEGLHVRPDHPVVSGVVITRSPQVQTVFSQPSIPREKFAVISGIGCSSGSRTT